MEDPYPVSRPARASLGITHVEESLFFFELHDDENATTFQQSVAST